MIKKIKGFYIVFVFHTNPAVIYNIYIDYIRSRDQRKISS